MIFIVSIEPVEATDYYRQSLGAFVEYARKGYASFDGGKSAECGKGKQL